MSQKGRRSEMVYNDSKWSKMVQNDPKWSKIVQNDQQILLHGKVLRFD
jgi:hypothetical protein